MPYIEPNSDIRLLSNVPIDTDYVHTLWFASADEQKAYFESKNRLYLTTQYYVRKGRGYIKIQAKADEIYDCNYMMYRNTSFGNKWFYAFINNIEYINNNTAMVNFTVDLLQTWLFEMHLNQCFIERQHSVTDAPGDNLIPEGLEGGEYVYNDGDYEWCHNWSEYDVIVLTSFQSSLTPTNEWIFTPGSTTGIVQGIITGLNRRIFRRVRGTNTLESLKSFLTAVINYGYSDGVVAIIMIPTEFHDEQLQPVTGIDHYVPRITSLDGYVPRNKKLLTHPYCFIEEQNCEGATAVLPQEYFTSLPDTPNILHFFIEFVESASPIASCIPIGYKNSVINRAEAMYINNFVQCSWNVDLFKAYLAQSLTARMGNQISDAIAGPVNTGYSDASHVYNNLIKPMLQGKMPSGTTPYEQQTVIPQNGFSELAASTVRSSAFPAMAAAATAYPLARMGTTNFAMFPEETARRLEQAKNVYNTMQELYAKAIAPPHNTGANSPDFLTGRDEKGFWFFHRTIRREFAEKIDKYFDMYGYAQHIVAIPNIHARSRYTYIKTQGAQIDGNIPTEAVHLIQSILDKGITFWADKTNFGNYSLPNNIV